MGAIVAPVQLERIRRWWQTGVAEGAALFQPEARTGRRCRRAAASIRRPCSADVHPSATVAREEIFGPVLVSMTFRTPDEAVMLANNSRYGLSASVWSETIGLALDVAPKLQVGVVWVNATNLFDAAVGFGGYRESGFGREGGREGVYEYLKPKAWAGGSRGRSSRHRRCAIGQSRGFEPPPVDRTAKLFIGGKQARPDGNYSRPVLSPNGRARRRGRRGQPQGHPQRRRGGARGGRLVARHRAQPGADPLLHRREPVGARRRSSRGGSAP